MKGLDLCESESVSEVLKKIRLPLDVWQLSTYCFISYLTHLIRTIFTVQ